MILIQKIAHKSVVWFQNSNQYLIVEDIVAQLFSFLDKEIPKSEIITHITQQVHIPQEQAHQFLSDAEQLFNQLNQSTEEEKNTSTDIPSHFELCKYYQCDQTVLQIDYASEYEAYLVHPKFAHLEIAKSQASNVDHHYQIFTKEATIFFYVDQELIGSWPKQEVHFFQGKCSMKFVEHLYQKSEEEWLGVFHASAITNGTTALLLLGDSGNGKSTALALLQAHGFSCLADDFVPVAASTQNIHHFPAAISIKKNSLPTLSPIYPELHTSAEYHFKQLGKVVRYLPTKPPNIYQAPCKALVFIKYEKEVSLKVDKISNLIALEQFIPDSWLSPIPKNVKTFLNWFTQLPCYQLTYGDNSKMLTTVSKIFDNEL